MPILRAVLDEEASNTPPEARRLRYNLATPPSTSSGNTSPKMNGTLNGPVRIPRYILRPRVVPPNIPPRNFIPIPPPLPPRTNAPRNILRSHSNSPPPSYEEAILDRRCTLPANVAAVPPQEIQSDSDSLESSTNSGDTHVCGANSSFYENSVDNRHNSI
ncbi:hypothetical protein J6590_070277 [Homalodisca vitripennis]|nr:hypothetical protein J6590_070277 [Homalodisca vitripennis]